MQIQKLLWLLLVPVFLSLFIGCQKQPEALFTIEESGIKIGEPVNFINLSSDASGYLWDFGDGTTSTETNPAHTFMDKGIFVVTLTAYSENSKKTDEMTTFISVSIFFTSPIEGTVFYTGGQHTISWDNDMSGNNYVALYLLKDGSQIGTITTGTSNGSFSWNVRDSLSTDSTYQIIAVVDASPQSEYLSDYFTIINDKYINITSPDSTDYIAPGASMQISWESNLDYYSDVIIELLKGGVLVNTITSNTNNDGSHSWAGYVGQYGTDYQIKISSIENLDIFGLSEAFTYEAASITVTYPDSSATLMPGFSDYIYWTSTITGSYNYVSLELYKGGNYLSLIDNSESNDGSYSYTATSGLAIGSDYQIKITSNNYPDVYGFSEQFTITNPIITVTSPTSTSTWSPGNNTIYWNSNLSTSQSVVIKLYKAGNYYSTISYQTNNDGIYSWNLPSGLTTSSDYQIMISRYGNSSVYDYSDYFTITD